MRYFKDSDGTLYAYDDDQITSDEKTANVATAQTAYDTAKAAYEADETDDNLTAMNEALEALDEANAVVVYIKDDLTELTSDEYTSAITPSDEEKMESEIESLNSSYDSNLDDAINEYNRAVARDGTTETTKVTAARQKITDLDTQYDTDLAAIIAKYED